MIDTSDRNCEPKQYPWLCKNPQLLRSWQRPRLQPTKLTRSYNRAGQGGWYQWKSTTLRNRQADAATLATLSSNPESQCSSQTTATRIQWYLKLVPTPPMMTIQTIKLGSTLGLIYCVLRSVSALARVRKRKLPRREDWPNKTWAATRKKWIGTPNIWNGKIFWSFFLLFIYFYFYEGLMVLIER